MFVIFCWIHLHNITMTFLLQLLSANNGSLKCTWTLWKEHFGVDIFPSSRDLSFRISTKNKWGKRSNNGRVKPSIAVGRCASKTPGASANPSCHWWPCWRPDISDLHFVLLFNTGWLSAYGALKHTHAHTCTGTRAVTLRENWKGQNERNQNVKLEGHCGTWQGILSL